MTTHAKVFPPIVSAAEWETARAELLKAEKAATREQDRIAAQRRRLPMVAFGEYTFTGPEGPVTLLDLFGEHQQLALYQHMDNGPDDICAGCTFGTKQVTALDELAKKDIAWATVSDMPITQMKPYFEKHAFKMPYASSHGTSFSKDCGAREHGGFVMNMFVRDGDKVYRTYSTTARGVDRLWFVSNIYDLAVYGRKEEWEDSPEGWPQKPTYG